MNLYVGIGHVLFVLFMGGLFTLADNTTRPLLIVFATKSLMATIGMHAALVYLIFKRKNDEQ